MLSNLKQLVAGFNDTPDLSTYEKRVALRKVLQQVAVEAKRLRKEVLRPSVQTTEAK